MFDVSKFVTIEPARWEYSYESNAILDMFSYFGFSQVIYFHRAKQHFVIYDKEVFSFYEGSDEVKQMKQIVGILNWIQFFIRRERDYIFFFREEYVIEKTSPEVFLQQKPPFNIFPMWHLFFKIPHGKTEIALRDLPDCNLLF